MIVPNICLQNAPDFAAGTDRPEVLILAAIEAGAQTIGFTTHACTSFDFQAGMDPRFVNEYRAKIQVLREQYADRIHVLIGEVRDFYADPDFWSGADFAVGAVGHLVADDGAICSLNCLNEDLICMVKDHFGGSPVKLVMRYFETVALLVRRTHCNIISDFDRIFRQGRNILSDVDLDACRSAALDAMERLAAEDAAFAVQVSVGHPTSFSPAPDQARWLASRGANFLFSSSAGSKEALLREWKQCALFANSCGIGGLSFPYRKNLDRRHKTWYD